MLTKTDFSQIRKIIREEVGNEASATKDELRSDIKMAMIRTIATLNEMQDRLKNVEIRIGNMHKELKKEIKMIADFLDKEDLRLRKRVELLEERLGISSN